MSDTKIACPKCGLPQLTGQKYCRACGARLQRDTKRLAKPEGGDVRSQSEQRRANTLVSIAFVIMLVGAAIGIVGKKLLHQDVVTVAGALISIVGIFLTAYPFLWHASMKSPRSTPPSRPADLEPPPASPYLPRESSVEYLPSITERTTNLLETPVATRSGQKEKGEES